MNQLLRVGAIDQKTYNRAVGNSRASLQSASRQASGFQSEIASQIPVVNRFAGASGGISPAWIGAGLAVGGAMVSFRVAKQVLSEVTTAVLGQMAEIDKLAKTSTKLGMMPDTLQAIRMAGSELAGMEFNTVDMAMQRMRRRLGEAAKGAGEAKAVIKELGLDAKLVSASDPGKAFEMIAEAMSKVDDPAQRLRMSFKLFDSEGVGMVNVLTQGSGVLEEYRAKLEALGQTVTLEDAMGVEAANDAMMEAEMAFSGVFRTLAIELGPAIAVVADNLTHLVSTFQLVSGEGLSISTTVASYVGSLQDFGIALKALGRIKMGDFVGGGTMLMEAAEFKNANRMAMEAEQLQNELAEKAKARRKEMEELRKSGGMSVGNETEKQRELAQAHTKAQQQLEALSTPEEKRIARLKELAGWLENGVVDQEQFNKLAAEAESNFLRLTSDSDGEKKAIDDAKKASDEITDLRTELEKPIDIGGLKLDSMQAGSAEAVALLNEITREQRFGKLKEAGNGNAVGGIAVAPEPPVVAKKTATDKSEKMQKVNTQERMLTAIEEMRDHLAAIGASAI